jgi:hypothetical protein
MEKINQIGMKKKELHTLVIPIQRINTFKA